VAQEETRLKRRRFWMAMGIVAAFWLYFWIF
jgi:hypothetical protein